MADLKMGVYRASVNRSNSEGYTGQYAGKINEKEGRDVLEGYS